MPYVKKERRGAIKPLVDALGAEVMDSPGDLNYAICRLVWYIVMNAPERLSYALINALIGALECAKLEIYRRVVVPYEDKKVMENGDVFGVSAS